MNKQVLIQEAKILLDDLPDETSRDDVMYRIYVRQKIEKGLSDCEQGKVFTSEQVMKYFDDRPFSAAADNDKGANNDASASYD